MKDYFINLSVNSESKTQKFLKGFTFYNTLTFTSSSVSYSLQEKYKNDYYFLKSLFSYFSNKYNDYKKVFLTITLPSLFHNITCDRDIQIAYQKLNEIFTKYRKFLNKYNVDLKYVRFVEAHKNFTPHFHVILYFNFSNARIMRDGKRFNINYAKNAFFRIKKNSGGGRSQFKIIRGDKGVQKYVSKYIAKSLNPKNILDLYLLDGWKKAGKMRLFTYSKIPLPRYVFKLLLQNSDITYSDINDSYSDLYSFFLENTKLNYYHKKKCYTTLGSSKFLYSVNIFIKNKYSYILNSFITKQKIRLYLYKNLFDPLLQEFFDIYKKEYYIKFEFKDEVFYDIDLIYYDFHNYFTYVETSWIYEDIEIYYKKDLIYKKSLNFLGRDLTK